MIDLSILKPLVWMDYRLAVIFTILCPLALLIWAFIRHVETFQQLLITYWKVSSLLAITLYLMIGGFGISFISGLLARLLMPLSLWFWVDLNEEIREQPGSPLKLVFTAWRWSLTAYGVLSALLLIPFLQCAFSSVALNAAACQTWLAAPQVYKSYFHAGTTNGFLGFWGIVGLVIYMLYLGYFVFFKLGRQGRSALN